jgi:hypothetical protein
MPIEKSDLLQGTLDIDRASARHSADCGQVVRATSSPTFLASPL